MSTSRRKFLKASMVAAAFAAVPSVFGPCGKVYANTGYAAEDTDPLATYTKATFQAHLRSVFGLQADSGVVAVTLTKIGDMPAPPGGECFSLQFSGGQQQLKQDTYGMQHPSLGNFSLFLVPVGADKKGVQSYLAIINRLPYGA